MKIFLRLFTSILSLVLVSFAVFGTLFFHSSFRTLLERELDSNSNQTKMIVFALLSSVESVESEYAPKEEDFSDIMRTLSANFSSQTSGMALYDSDREALYEKGIAFDEETLTDITISVNKNTAVQKVVTMDGSQCVVSFSSVELCGENYLLSVAENVEYLYDYRRQMYRYYCMITGLIIVLAGLVSFALAYHFAKPIGVLAKTSISFANGEYEERVKVVGNDELTDMMSAFNFMAERLSDNIQELFEAARRQEEFTGAFAHELKTPLTSIIGYSDMLQTMELTDEERFASANYIYRQGKRLERLSRSMLLLTSVNSGEIVMEKIPATRLFDEAYGIVEAALKKDGVSCKMDAEDAWIEGEMDLLATLLTNLMDNARKACAGVDGNIEVKGICAQEEYCVTVSDNGCGIPEEDIPKVSEAFFMVDKSRSRKAGGAGLGLTLCSKIVSRHGGVMEIQSVLQRGTTVTVRLPLVKEMRKNGEVPYEKQI